MARSQIFRCYSFVYAVGFISTCLILAALYTKSGKGRQKGKVASEFNIVVCSLIFMRKWQMFFCTENYPAYFFLEFEGNHAVRNQRT